MQLANDQAKVAQEAWIELVESGKVELRDRAAVEHHVQAVLEVLWEVRVVLEVEQAGQEVHERVVLALQRIEEEGEAVQAGEAAYLEEQISATLTLTTPTHPRPGGGGGAVGGGFLCDADGTGGAGGAGAAGGPLFGGPPAGGGGGGGGGGGAEGAALGPPGGGGGGGAAGAGDAADARGTGGALAKLAPPPPPAAPAFFNWGIPPANKPASWAAGLSAGGADAGGPLDGGGRGALARPPPPPPPPPPPLPATEPATAAWDLSLVWVFFSPLPAE